MRKIGLYVQETSASGLREMLARVRPAVVLVHLDGGDLAGWIREALPETFVIGRMYWTQEQQDSLLGMTGAEVAGLVLAAKEAPSCHAFMMFNEAMGSPVDHGAEPEFRARAARLDKLQVDFRAALVAQGKEAVAFNFGAGNWPAVSHYREFFPLTMGAYRYLGFHVYAWPRLTSGDWHSNFGETLGLIDALPDKICILTEVAVTRAYAQPGHPDLGWLSEGDGAPLGLDAYAADITGVNDELCRRANVMGACLFNAAPDARWLSFAVTPELVGRLAALPECGTTKVVTTEIVLRPPFEGAYRMTQGFGERPEVYKAFGLKGHEGVDWALPLGTPVLACADGVVERVDTVDLKNRATDPYGLSVRIKHEKCLTIYAHLSRVDVVKGTPVRAGERIGLSGSTGNSDGPHLHLSLKLDGANVKDGMLGTVDPMKYMPAVKPPAKPPTQAQQIAEILKRLAAIEQRLTELEAGR